MELWGFGIRGPLEFAHPIVTQLGIVSLVRRRQSSFITL